MIRSRKTTFITFRLKIRISIRNYGEIRIQFLHGHEGELRYITGD